MNCCFIEIDENVKINDEVEFLGDNIRIENLANNLNISMHEILLGMK